MSRVWLKATYLDIATVKRHRLLGVSCYTTITERRFGLKAETAAAS